MSNEHVRSFLAIQYNNLSPDPSMFGDNIFPQDTKGPLGPWLVMDTSSRPTFSIALFLLISVTCAEPGGYVTSGSAVTP